MRRSVSLGLSLVGLLVLAGCGNSADSLIKKQIADMNKLADAIESDADEDAIKKISERLKKNGEALDKLDLSDSEKKRLAEKYSEDLGKAMKRLVTASMTKASGDMNSMMKGMFEGMGKGVDE